MNFLKKSLFAFGMITASLTLATFTSCSEDIDIVNVNGGGCNGNGTSHLGTSDSKLIINFGDSDYGKVTRSVVGDDAVKDNDGVLTNNKYYVYNDFSKGWEDGDAYIVNDDKKASLPYGSSRMGVYAEAFINNSPYANGWSCSHTFDDGIMTINANEITNDKGYYYPMKVLYYGNYNLVTTNKELTSYKESDYYGNESSSDWKPNEVDASTVSSALSRNIQYATSVFKAIVNVADEVTVWADDGKTTKKLNRDDMKFSIQYFYVESSSAVKYKEDFTYEPSNETVTYKYPLKDNGLFGKTDNEVDKFDSWESNYANLSILPTSKKEVRVVLVCKYFGEDNAFYVYDPKKKQYTHISTREGSNTFYIYGKISVNDNTTVDNKGNALCPKSGASGVFIPDVRTTATITIDKLAEEGKSGENDPVVIDPSKDDIQSKFLYNIDVVYGNMEADWTQGKHGN